MPGLEHSLLAGGLLTVLFALGAAGALRSRERRVVGELVHAARDPRRMRPPLAAAAVLLLAFALRQDAPTALLSSAILLAVLALLFLSPVAGDRVCGMDGVRSGWELLGHSDFAEWRLTGDHLRFRGRGEWDAVALPRGFHDALRARLEEAAPGRESRFRE